jgi:hypothetical protein
MSTSNSKRVLVVCSNPNNPTSDFNDPLNQRLRDAFGPDPEYEFCDKIINGCVFPDDLIFLGKSNFDIIWFAGCNLITNIFSDNHVFEKLNYLMEPNGFIVFTETANYVNRYGLDPYVGLTLPFSIIAQHTNRVRPNSISENQYNDFLRNYNEFFNDGFYYYNLKTSGGSPVRKRRKSKGQKKRQNRNRTKKQKRKNTPK